MALACDVSAILGLVLEDEDAAYAEAVIEAIGADEALVPTLFWFELRNVLIVSERRKRITREDTALFLADLALLSIDVDDAPRETTVLTLARQHKLTVYDAAYLELAQRKHLPLATLDADLAKAARKIGVGIFVTP